MEWIIARQAGAGRDKESVERKGVMVRDKAEALSRARECESQPERMLLTWTI